MRQVRYRGRGAPCRAVRARSGGVAGSIGGLFRIATLERGRASWFAVACRGRRVKWSVGEAPGRGRGSGGGSLSRWEQPGQVGFDRMLGAIGAGGGCRQKPDQARVNIQPMSCMAPAAERDPVSPDEIDMMRPFSERHIMAKPDLLNLMGKCRCERCYSAKYTCVCAYMGARHWAFRSCQWRIGLICLRNLPPTRSFGPTCWRCAQGWNQAGGVHDPSIRWFCWPFLPAALAADRRRGG